MKIAVISDIHGNIWALENVLEDIQKKRIKTILNLGDHFYGPLRPNETFQQIKKTKMVSISGNGDRYILENSEKEVKDSQTMEYLLSDLDPEAISWLTSLPDMLLFENSIFLTHGKISVDDECLVEKITQEGVQARSNRELADMVRGLPHKIILCGHSHVNRFIDLGNGQVILNPGSVGLPAYRDDFPTPHAMESYSPHAKYASFEIENSEIVSYTQQFPAV